MNVREPASKAQWIVDYNALVKKEKLLEKEVNGRLFGKKNALPPQIVPLLTYQQELDKLRLSEESNIYGQLRKIKASISRVHQVPKVKDDTYWVALENLLNFIEKDIVAFKIILHERREKLSIDEMAMEREMQMLEKRIDNLESEILMREEEISSSAPTHPHKSVKAERARVNEDTPPEVVALQAFLRDTGENGGWPERDHQQFLLIRNQCKGNMRQLLERCVYEIPEKDYNMIEDHEDWFNKFSVLLQAQKAAIQRWKVNKEAIRANDMLLQEEKQAREAAKVRQHEVDTRKREKEERELRIMEWKEEQKKKDNEAKMQQIQEEERKAAEAKDREMQRRALVKAKLKEHMIQKEEEDRQRQGAEAQKFVPTNKVSAKDLERFQERDRMKEIEKQQKTMTSNMQKADKEARLEKIRKKVQVSAPRDPSRLTKPTAAFEVRVHEVEEKPLYPNMEFNGPFATRRAVPSWRQGV